MSNPYLHGRTLAVEMARRIEALDHDLERLARGREEAAAEAEECTLRIEATRALRAEYVAALTRAGSPS